MAMRDLTSVETKLQDEVLELITAFKKSEKLRYRSDAIRTLVELGIKRKNGDVDLPPKYTKNFDNKEGRVGFSVNKKTVAFVKQYALNKDIEFQVAYFELICCGLIAVKSKLPFK